MSLVVVRHPHYGVTYGSVRSGSSVSGPTTSTVSAIGLTGRGGSFLSRVSAERTQNLLLLLSGSLPGATEGDAALCDAAAAGLFQSPVGYVVISMLEFLVLFEPTHRIVHALIACDLGRSSELWTLL